MQLPVWGQNTSKPQDKSVDKLIEKGIAAYDSAEYEKAETYFRKALSEDQLNAVAAYNLGLTETEMEKNLEAAHFFQKAAKLSDQKSLKSQAYYNEGNVWFGKKKYEKAIEAYKNALRNNPSDEEARYNLALAQQKLKQQQKKNNKQNKKDQQKNKQDKKDQKKNKDQNKDQNKKDQNKKDQQKNKDQQKKDQQKQNKSGDKNKKDQDKKGQDKKDQKGDQKDKKNKGDKPEDKKQDKGKGDQKKKDQNKSGDQKDKQNKSGDKKGDQQKQPQQGEGQPQKAKLTPQQVKQILVALKNKEQKTQKKIKAKVLKGKGVKKKQDKDW